MKYKRFIFLLSASLFICSVSFGQARQICPVSEKNSLDRKVCDSKIKWKDSHIVWLLPDVFYSVKVPAGISIIFNKDSEEEPLQNFTPNSFVLRDVLNKIITVQSQYQWKEEDGVINVYPTNDYPVLDIRISDYQLENGTVADALEKLLETSEFENHLKENHLFEEDSVIHGGTESQRQKQFSIKLQNSTIREILNEIVKANETGTWMYGEYGSKDNEKEKRYRLGIYN